MADLAGIYGFLSWNDVMRTVVIVKSTENIVFVRHSPISDWAVDSRFLKSGGHSHSTPASADPIEYHFKNWIESVFACVNFYYETNY
jgi:hypothetical protein